MENLFYFWLVISLLFLIFEIGSPGLFYFLSFCVGAAVSAIISLYYNSATVQSMAFLASTITSLIIFKHGIHSWRNSSKSFATNVYALHGKQGIVLQDIVAQASGTVKVDGQIWSAKALYDDLIPTGTMVEVVSCTGAFLVVKQIQK